jgi:hypothetical protein
MGQRAPVFMAQKRRTIELGFDSAYSMRRLCECCRIEKRNSAAAIDNTVFPELAGCQAAQDFRNDLFSKCIPIRCEVRFMRNKRHQMLSQTADVPCSRPRKSNYEVTCKSNLKVSQT